MVILKSLLKFYQADSCGILEWSSQRNIWIPSLWYTKDGGELGNTVLSRTYLNESELKWLDVLIPKDANRNTTTEIVIEDIRQIRRRWTSLEMNLLDECSVSNVQAIWFSSQVEGFIFVKNPKYAAMQTDYLHVALGLLIQLAAELKMMTFDFDCQGADPILDQELADNEMVVRILGDVKIRIGKYQIFENTMRSKHGWLIFCYLLLNTKDYVSMSAIIKNDHEGSQSSPSPRAM